MSRLVDKFKSLFSRKKQQSSVDSVSVQDLNAVVTPSPWQDTIFDGNKFFGGFGTTNIQHVDYWTLRARSAQLFNENLYARGLIRRLVTNEINTGLTPDVCPDESIIGVPEESLIDWSENIENRFNIWAKNSRLCDWKKSMTFGAIQALVRQEALVSGDILVVLIQSPSTRLPMIQLVSGGSVMTPLAAKTDLRKGHTIVHGVELDLRKRAVAYWIRQDDGTFKRLGAFGERTGRLKAWLVFGTDKRLDDVRGQPLLSLVLQSLKEIDRYRDSTQRKAVINSIIAMSVEKNADKPGSLPVTGVAVRRDAATVTDSDGTARNFDIVKQIPGAVVEELQMGEKLNMHGGQGTDLNFPEFEQAIMNGYAWANEIPPEILTMMFTNNYSASQAATSEFKIYLNKRWTGFGEDFCQPIYIEWFISETLTQKIDAPGFLEAWRDPKSYDVFGAWIGNDWYGSMKPSIDVLKQSKGSKNLISCALSTHTKEARHISGTKWTKNVRKLKRENELLVEALKPLEQLQMNQDQKAEPAGNEELVDDLKALVDRSDDNESFVEGLTEVLDAAQ